MTEALPNADAPEEEVGIKFPAEFGSIFQETIIYCILTDSRWANDVADILEPSYFQNIYLSTLVRAIFKFKKNFGVIPVAAVLQTAISKEVQDKRLKGEMIEILKRIFEDPTYKNGASYTKANVLNFCRVKRLDQSLVKAHQMANQDGMIDFNAVCRTVQNGLQVVTQKNTTEYKSSFENRIKAVNEKVPRIPTGLTEIDAVLRGGLPIKKYGIVMTFTSGGKTHMLVSLGKAALLAGYNVLHLSLEDDENDVALRYDASISGIPAEQFLINPELQRRVKSIIDKVPGNLYLKEYPGRTASVLTVRNHIERMIEDGCKPSLVLVDYISEMKPVDKRERRHELAEISRDFRATAVEYELALWTAAQSQRYTMRKKVVRLEEIGEAYEASHPADLMLTIGQTAKDATQGVCRLFIAKNKVGKDLQLYIADFQKDLSRFKIRETIDTSTLDVDSIGFSFDDNYNN